MKEIVYPRKLDVPCTLGNIFDLAEFFCVRKNSRSIAQIEVEKCMKLHYN